jgi:23S rRNA (uracil1939-C5)-methyltransferase
MMYFYAVKPESTVPIHSKCTHFPGCGGCTSLDRTYEVQLKEKHTRLSALFLPVVADIPPIVPSPQAFYYRHKVQLPFGYTGQGKTGRLLLGCYGTNSHRVVDQRMCLIQDKDCSRIAWTVREWARQTGMSVYNEKTRQGFLRHVLLRRAAGTGEVLVGLVTNGGRIPGSRQLSKKLLAMIEEQKLDKSTVVGIVQNVNTRDTNVVLGNEEIEWWGRPFIKETLGTLRYKIGLSTFFQVNPFQTPRLYNEVLCHIPDGARVLDCYCGVGSIALWVARKASAVHGIEENRGAVAAAREAAKVNGIGNVTFRCGDSGAEMSRLSHEGYTCAIVDPPRKGLADGFVPALADSSINRIIYVSCNPETLKSDIIKLSPHFSLKSLKGIDMFPHTDHIECVALLDRK